ncbi:hypothetical protein H8E77_33285, partial [bacterium]|nr:hypothetical protein [bacterium]
VFIADNASEQGPTVFLLPESEEKQALVHARGFSSKNLWGMTFDATGNLYVSGNNPEELTGTVYKVTHSGQIEPLLVGLHYPTGLTIHDGWLYIVDYAEGKILRVKINTQPAQGW